MITVGLQLDPVFGGHYPLFQSWLWWIRWSESNKAELGIRYGPRLYLNIWPEASSIVQFRSRILQLCQTRLRAPLISEIFNTPKWVPCRVCSAPSEMFLRNRRRIAKYAISHSRRHISHFRKCQKLGIFFLNIYQHTEFQCPPLTGVNVAPMLEFCMTVTWFCRSCEFQSSYQVL
jgi:hypothetical protein